MKFIFIFCFLLTSRAYSAELCHSLFLKSDLSQLAPPYDLSLQPYLKMDHSNIIAFISDVRTRMGLDPNFSADQRPIFTDLTLLSTLPPSTRTVLFVLKDSQNSIRGTVGIYERNQGMGELKMLYLDSSLRGQQLGKFLLEQALDQAKKFNFKQVLIQTDTFMIEARDLYEKSGFQQIPNTNPNTPKAIYYLLTL